MKEDAAASVKMARFVISEGKMLKRVRRVADADSCNMWSEKGQGYI